MSEYVLGTHAAELERLRFQHGVWKALTDAFLEQLELSPGARCLDLGCGPGFVSRELAARVGPRGAVLCVDEAAHWLEDLERCARAEGLAQLRTRRARIEELALTPEERGAGLDLVFSRWVLSFLPDPGAAVAAAARWLKPGGRLALIDYNHEGVSLFPPSAGFDAAIRVTRELYARTGGDPFVAGRLPALFRAAGLELERYDPRVLAGGPGSGVFRWADSFFPDRVGGWEEQGLMSAEERAAFDADWEARKRDPDARFFSPIVVCASARRPL